MQYAIEHEGKAITPNGTVSCSPAGGVTPGDVETRNLELEEKEIAWIKTAPDRLFLYVKDHSKSEVSHFKESIGKRPDSGWSVTTWMGTHLGIAFVGEKKHMGFGWNSYRRHITTRIFGTLYHGWYMASSGDYCRLVKAKDQR